MQTFVFPLRVKVLLIECNLPSPQAMERMLGLRPSCTSQAWSERNTLMKMSSRNKNWGKEGRLDFPTVPPRVVCSVSPVYSSALSKSLELSLYNFYHLKNSILLSPVKVTFVEIFKTQRNQNRVSGREETCAVKVSFQKHLKDGSRNCLLLLCNRTWGEKQGRHGDSETRIKHAGYTGSHSSPLPRLLGGFIRYAKRFSTLYIVSYCH